MNHPMRTIAAGALVVAVLAGCSNDLSGLGQPISDRAEQILAEDMANNFVKDRLKSPGSASFNEDTSVRDGDTWTVTGSVDSQNGFGALLRSTFTVKMTQTGDTYKVVDMNIDDGGQ